VALSNNDVTAIAKELAEEMTSKKRSQWVDPSTHAEHHEWISERMQAEEEIKAFRRKIIQSSIVWVVPLSLGFVGVALWRHLKYLISQ